MPSTASSRTSACPSDSIATRKRAALRLCSDPSVAKTTENAGPLRQLHLIHRPLPRPAGYRPNPSPWFYRPNLLEPFPALLPRAPCGESRKAECHHRQPQGEVEDLAKGGLVGLAQEPDLADDLTDQDHTGQ